MELKIKGKVAILTESFSNFTKATKYLEKFGYKWGANSNLERYYDMYGEETCISVSEQLSYSPYDYYDRAGYKILSLHEFMKIHEGENKLIPKFKIGDIIRSKEYIYKVVEDDGLGVIARVINSINIGEINSKIYLDYNHLEVSK